MVYFTRCGRTVKRSTSGVSATFRAKRCDACWPYVALRRQVGSRDQKVEGASVTTNTGFLASPSRTRSVSRITSMPPGVLTPIGVRS